MANTLYPNYKKVSLSPGLDLVAGSTLKAALISTTTGAANYTYSATDQFFSAVPSGAIVAPGVALSGKAAAVSGSNGVLTAAPLVWPAVSQVASQTGQAIILYNDTGTAGTSLLIAYMDTETGLPVTPNGADITFAISASVIQIS
jgi:hypothetical protein